MKKIVSMFLSVLFLFGLFHGGISIAAEEEAFLHPGILNTENDLERIRNAVERGEEPYLSGYNALISNSYAEISAPRAVETIVRGGDGSNFALLYQDVTRAYLCAIRWKISGDTAYADCARDILNAWSATLKTATGNADRYLTAIYSYQMAAASELMRDYPGFEKERMQDMLLNVFYKPLTERFLYSNEYGKDHNDAHIMNYWANWDLSNMAAAAAIGVFCDRRDIYDRAIEYYKAGAGNGSIFNAVPKIYEASKDTMNVPIGQWQEAGRDMEHTQLGLGLMASLCEIAYNQGDDIYGWANNRLLYGAEYVAQYHLGKNVPFTEYNWYSGRGSWSSQTVISGRSGIRPIFEMIYNHYNKRKGLDTPGLEALLETVRPEGGAGGHASTFDQTGFGTLLYTRDKGDDQGAVLGESGVESGIYRITSKKSGRALTDDDGVVRQYSVDEEDKRQLWKITDLGGGIYTITNLKTGNAMSIDGGSYANVAPVVTSAYEGKFSQQFALLSFDDVWDNYYNGAYRIAAIHSGLSFDVMNASINDGAEVIQYTYNQGSHQQWELTKVEYAPSVSFVDEETAYFSAPENAQAIIAFYDSEGSLTEIKTFNVNGKKTVEFTAPDSGKVKLMLWGDNLKPLIKSEERSY